jgi:hypothetical protein
VPEPGARGRADHGMHQAHALTQTIRSIGELCEARLPLPYRPILLLLGARETGKRFRLVPGPTESMKPKSEAQANVRRSRSQLVSVLSLLLVVHLLVHGNIQLTVALLLLVLLPLLTSRVGLEWLLPSLAVFLHSVGQIAGELTTALVPVSPPFCLPSALLEDVRVLATVHPVSFPIEQTRDVIAIASRRMERAWPSTGSSGLPPCAAPSGDSSEPRSDSQTSCDRPVA